jgi:hypothetical protein
MKNGGTKVASVALMRRLPSWLTTIAVVAVAVCVGSCARTWNRAGADAADLSREQFECQFEASKGAAADGAPTEIPEAKANELERLCMEAKGWSRSWGR